MKLIKFINHYFLAEEGESIHWSDFYWFYGTYTTCIIIIAVVIL